MPIRVRVHTRFRPGGRFALLFALTCLMAVSISPAASGADTPNEILTIETIGTGPVNEEDPFAAEQIATNNALGLAIDQAVATVLPSEILADNFEEIVAIFYGGAEAFILNYKKLAVAKGVDYCRVLVRAAIPADAVKERIRKSGIMIDRESSPRLLILLSEERPGQPPVYWWQEDALKVMTAAEKAMTEDFKKRGITVVAHGRHIPLIHLADYRPELNDEKAIEIGRHLGADFVITGMSSVALPDKFAPDMSKEGMGVLDARLLDINTNSIIFMSTLHRHADDAEASSGTFSALASVGKAAAQQFAPAVIAVFEQQKNRPHIFEIRIQGAGYLANLNAFRNLLDAIDSINRPQIQEMKIDEAVISVDFSGSPRKLARALIETRSDRLAVTVIDVLEDGVVIELTNAVRAFD